MKNWISSRFSFKQQQEKQKYVNKSALNIKIINCKVFDNSNNSHQKNNQIFNFQSYNQWLIAQKQYKNSSSPHKPIKNHRHQSNRLSFQPIKNSLSRFQFETDQILLQQLQKKQIKFQNKQQHQKFKNIEINKQKQKQQQKQNDLLIYVKTNIKTSTINKNEKNLQYCLQNNVNSIKLNNNYLQFFYQSRYLKFTSNTTLNSYLILDNIRYPLSVGKQIKIAKNKYLVIGIKNNNQFQISTGNQVQYNSNIAANKQTTNLQLNDKQNHQIAQQQHYETLTQCLALSQVQQNQSVSENFNTQCKYCLMTQKQFKLYSIQTNPHNKNKRNHYNHFMVSPCKCKGSCSLVHFQCLKNYIMSKMIKINPFFQHYKTSQLKCELCKEEISLLYQFPIIEEDLSKKKKIYKILLKLSILLNKSFKQLNKIIKCNHTQSSKQFIVIQQKLIPLLSLFNLLKQISLLINKKLKWAVIVEIVRYFSKIIV